MRLKDSQDTADLELLDDGLDPRDPLQVAGSLDQAWLWVGIIFTAVLAVSAGAALAVRPNWVVWLAGPAMLCGVVSGAVLIRQWNRRAWVTFQPSGFRWTSRGGDREYADTDVLGLGLLRRGQHSFGRLVSERQVLRLWIGDVNARPLEMTVRTAVGEEGPLGPLVRRLQSNLLAAAEDSLRRGPGISGDHWSWVDRAIICGRGGSRQTILNLADISAVDESQGEVRVWKNLDPLPELRLSLAHRDAWLLSRLLQRRFARPGSPDVPPASGLGRILREHRPRSAMIASALLAMFAAVVAGVCFAAAIWARMLPLVLVGIGVGMTAVALISTAVRLSRSSFRLHEKGISQTTLSGYRYLGFGEIDQFAFDAKRQYSRGRYLGTMFTMVFVSQGRPRDSMFHSERAAFETEDIIQLRDRVSEEVASRLVRRWVETRSVGWTPELTILEESLRYERRRGMLWKSPPIEVPLSEIGAFDISDGWFYVWGIEHDDPLIRIRTSSPNFYAGLLLFGEVASNHSIA
jgi:hypothetical protein